MNTSVDLYPKVLSSFLFVPSPGDTINTTSHPKLFNLPMLLAKFMIQREQKKKKFKVWKHTHSMIFLGSLPKPLLAQYAPVLTQTLKLSLTQLSENDDWVFSYTYPRCTLVRWKDIRESDWDCYRVMDSNDLTGYISPIETHQWRQYELQMLKESCFELLGRRYDIPQLLRWIAGRLFKVSRSNWRIIPDLFSSRKVCSVAVAFGYEATRQAVRELTGKAPWVRLFRDVEDPPDVEATMPADIANTRTMQHVATSPSYK